MHLQTPASQIRKHNQTPAKKKKKNHNSGHWRVHGGGSESYRGGCGGGGREICFNFPIRKGKYGEKKI